MLSSCSRAPSGLAGQLAGRRRGTRSGWGGNYVAVTFGCYTKTASHAGTPPMLLQLFSQTKTIDQVVITVDVTTLQIIKKAAALADQLQQSAARMIVLLVSLEMVGQFIDALRQQRDLDFRRSGVGAMRLVLRNQFEFSLFC